MEYDSACDRRSAAQDLTAFKALRAAPVTMGSFTMPANARLAVQPGASILAGLLCLRANFGKANVRSLYTPALASGKIYNLPLIERGRVITITAGTTVNIYVLDQWCRPYKIAQL